MLQFYLEVYQNILSIIERTFSRATLKKNFRSFSHLVSRIYTFSLSIAFICMNASLGITSLKKLVLCSVSGGRVVC